MKYFYIIITGLMTISSYPADHVPDDLADLATLRVFLEQLTEVQELPTQTDLTRSGKTGPDKLYGFLVVKNQLLTKNLTVCNDTILNNLVVDGVFDICGVPACQLANGYALLITATSADIPNTLVLRDNTGSFYATNITLTDALELLAANDNIVTLQANASTNAYTFQLPPNTGNSDDVLATNGAGVTSWLPVSSVGGITDLNGLTTSTQYFAVGTAGTSLNIMSAMNTHTFNLPNASTTGVTGGVISNAEYLQFSSTYTTLLAGTPLDIPNTLVLRDNTGSFAATTITVTGAINFLAVNNNTVTIQPNPSTSTYPFTLPPNSGIVNYVLSTDGTGVTSWQSISAEGAITDLNNLTTSTQFFANGYAGIQPTFNSAINTHTLNIPLASTYGVLAGLITSTDYYHFQNTYTTIGALNFIATITGDTGSISGQVVSLQAKSTAGSSVTFQGSGMAMTLNVTDSLFNTMIGLGAGNLHITGTANTAFGGNAGSTLTSGFGNVLIAAGSITTGNNNVLISGSASGTTSSCVAIGVGTSGATNAVVIGGAASGNTNGVALGANASSGTNSVAYGYGASATGSNCIGIGYSLSVPNSNGIGIGYEASVSGQHGILIGGISNTVNGTQATVIGGNNNTASGFNSYALGQNASASNNYSFVYSDSTLSPYSSHANNSFNVRAAGGAYFDANITTTGNVAFVTNGNTVTLQPNSLTTTYTFQLPPNPGVANSVLTTNGTGNTSWQTYASGIMTITGDTGSVSGSAVSLTAQTTAGSSVTFQGVGTAMTLNVTDALANTIMGLGAGNTLLTGSCNTALGYNAASALTNGSFNVFLGYEAGFKNTSGTFNTFAGASAGAANTTGINNTFVGTSAGAANTTASGNTFVGISAGANVTIGGNNTILGQSAAPNLTTGTANTLLGTSAGNAYTSSESNNIVIGYSITGKVGESNVTRIGNNYIADGTNSLFVGQAAGNLVYTGTGNIGIGQLALASLTTGTLNTVVGVQAGKSITSGSGNTVVGQLAAQLLTTGTGNVIIGQNDGLNLITGSSNTLLGTQAGSAYTGSESGNIVVGQGVTGITGENNVTRIGNNYIVDATTNMFIGQGAGNKTYSGSNNVGLGYVALSKLTTGTANTVIGGGAGQNITSGFGNTLFGFNTGSSITTGTSNTIIGYTAGTVYTTGYNNIVIGYNVNGASATENNTTRIGNNYIADSTNSIFVGQAAGNLVYTGTGNIGIGQVALASLTSGARNTIIGVQAGTTITSGAGNTIVGQLAGSSYTSSESNNILIGQGVTGTTGESSVIRIGSGQTSCYVAGINGIAVTGSAVLVNSSNQLGTLVSSERFKENISDMGDYSSPIMNLRPVIFNYKTTPDVISSGLIAEEVAQIMPQLVYYDADGLPYTVQYHDLPALLLNELQKLQKPLASWQEQVEMLEARVDQLEQNLRRTISD